MTLPDAMPDPESRTGCEAALLRELQQMGGGEGHRLLDKFMDRMDELEDELELLRAQRKLLISAAEIAGFHMKPLKHCWKFRRLMEKEPDKFLRQKMGEEYANVYRLASGLPGFAEPTTSIEAVVQDAQAAVRTSLASAQITAAQQRRARRLAAHAVVIDQQAQTRALLGYEGV